MKKPVVPQLFQRANVYWNEGELYDASINRSPTSYDLNPESVDHQSHSKVMGHLVGERVLLNEYFMLHLLVGRRHFTCTAAQLIIGTSCFNVN